MRSRVLIVAILILAIFNVLSFYSSTQAQSKIDELQKSVENKTNKVVVYDGKDGRNGENGVDGKNAVSYSISQLTVKEVPLPGTPGKDGTDGIKGEDGAFQEIRVNDSGDIENKLSNDKYWTVLVPCSAYRMECSDGN